MKNIEEFSGKSLEERAHGPMTHVWQKLDGNKGKKGAMTPWNMYELVS